MSDDLEVKAREIYESLPFQCSEFERQHWMQAITKALREVREAIEVHKDYWRTCQEDAKRFMAQNTRLRAALEGLLACEELNSDGFNLTTSQAISNAQAALVTETPITEHPS